MHSPPTKQMAIPAVGSRLPAKVSAHSDATVNRCPLTDVSHPPPAAFPATTAARFCLFWRPMPRLDEAQYAAPGEFRRPSRGSHPQAPTAEATTEKPAAVVPTAFGPGAGPSRRPGTRGSPPPPSPAASGENRCGPPACTSLGSTATNARALRHPLARLDVQNWWPTQRPALARDSST